MISHLQRVLWAGFAGLCLGLQAQNAAAPARYPIDPRGLALVVTPGVAAEVVQVAPEQGGPAVRVSFDKAGEERRFVALEMRPKDALAAYKAADARVRLTLAEAQVARLAVLAYERGGGAWFRAGNVLAVAAEPRDCRFSLQGLRQAAFSQDTSGQLEWDQVERVWIGLVVDGKGKGSFELAQMQFTSEPYRPTEPVSIFRPVVAEWAVGADPAVTGKEAEVVEADGVPCLRLRFHFPGGRHMYYVPVQNLGELEYSAYAGIRFTYRAKVPAGIQGLLFSVFESNGQFVATPAPAATGEWVTEDIPWTAFPLASWTKDDNGRLDLDAISRVSVGAHGTASGEGGDGEILIKAIEVVPAGK